MAQIKKCLVSEENIKRSGDKRTKSQRRRKVQKAASPDLYCQRRPKIWRFQTTEKIKKTLPKAQRTRGLSSKQVQTQILIKFHLQNLNQ